MGIARDRVPGGPRVHPPVSSTSTPLHWQDRVYGDVSIDDPAILALIACPTVQRLGRIRQAGPSALAFPFKTVTRLEHSLGVYLLLRRLGASLREQVAGLLHDVSHTAFSHAVDFLHTSEEQDHHERIKPAFLQRPDLVAALDGLGFTPEAFVDDSIYPLLERPLPWLCADRLDYFLRDSLACGVSTPESVGRTLNHTAVADGRIVLDDPEVARDVTHRFDEMNRDWWASPTEAFIYNEFAEALAEGYRLGAITDADLHADDDAVLAGLRNSPSPLIHAKLHAIEHFHPGLIDDYRPKVIPKVRWLDPPVLIGPGRWRRLSEIAARQGSVIPG
jgi:HD superfamily phosphohydrolase